MARVYDIGNTSTKMVLLNRRLKKKSQLRGLTDNNGEIVAPEPDRHIPDEPTTNWHFHRNCLNSSSAPYRPKISLDLGWVNTQQRPPITFDSGSYVNHRRHTSCCVSSESPLVGWNPHRRPHTSPTRETEEELRSMGSMLNDPDLSLGERRYLYSIARIYSMSQMKQLKKDQYSQLLLRELTKGYHSPYEYERYYNYLNSPRKTQCGRMNSYRDDHRSQSVPPPADSHHDTSGRGTQGGDMSRSESKKKNKMTASSRSLQMSSTSSRTSMASGRQSQRSRGSKKTKSKSTPKNQQLQSPPSSAERSTASKAEPATPKSPLPVQREEPEPVAAVAAANTEVVVDGSDDVDNKTNDNDRYGEPENSSRENDIRSTETSRQDAASPTEDESPRKGEENTEIPVEQASEPVENSSEPVEKASNHGYEADAERSEDNKERSSEERENLDDDYDGTDDEGGKSKQQSIKEISQTPQQKERRYSMDEKTDTASIEDQDGERGDEEATIVDVEKRAGSPKKSIKRTEDNHENEGQRSLIIPVTPREAGGNGAANQRASDGSGAASRKASNEEVLDLSAESHNRDVDKIEY